MGSLRHPDLTLRDTIALKLLVMLGADFHNPAKLAMAREWVDDLREYIQEEVVS